MSNLSTSNTDFNASKGGAEDVQVQEQVTNVFFSEEREVTNSRVLASQPTFSSAYSDSILMPENKWLLSEILTRPVQLPTIAWSTTDAFSVSVADLDIPRSVYALNVVPISVLLSMMSYLRSDWTIRLQINSPKFSQGRLLVYFDPMYVRPIGTGSGSVNQLCVYNAMVLPHAWLDPSESKVVELVLPFRHVLDYFALNASPSLQRLSTINSLGVLHFIVFNPLQVSTGTSGTVYITPSIYAQSPSVHVPTSLHALENPVSMLEVTECGLSDAPAAIADAITAGVAIASGSPGMVTSTLKAVSSVSKVLSNLDRPLSYGEIMLPCNRMVAPFAHGSGVDSSIRLSLIENSQTSSSENNAGEADKEMDLSTILKIPTVITILSWLSSSGADTVLAYLPVTPMYMTRPFDGVTQANIAYCNLAAWGARFRYWRGGLRFRFSFVCTQFHAGRLRVSFFPNNWDPTNIPGATQGASVPSMIMDLQAKKEFEFVVPYYSDCPYLQTSYPYDAVETLNTHFDATVGANNLIGSLVVYILNPLIVNSNAPGSIPINVFLSAADDFEYSGLTPLQPELINPTAVSECGLVEVPGEIQQGEQLILKPTANVLSHGDGIVVSPFLFQAGESYMNIKNLIRRFSFINSFQLAATTPIYPNVQIFKIPIKPNNFYANISASDNRNQSLFAYISSFFLNWKGSIRFKVVSTVSKNAQLLVYAYHDLLDSSESYSNITTTYRYQFSSFGSTAMNFSDKPALELEVPYFSPFSQMINYNPPTVFIGNYTCSSNLKLMFVSTADSVFPVVAGALMDVFSAAGDDFVLSYYLGPLIFVAPATDFPR